MSNATDAQAALRDAVRELRDTLDRTSNVAHRSGNRAHAEEMSLALARRDRDAAELRRHADERLTALQQTTAAVQALRDEVARLTGHLAAVSAENEQLRRAAQERLELLEANERAYAEFRAQLQTRFADLSRFAG
jgi:chromosome segregation ATPase